MTPATATAAATRSVCAGGCGTVLSCYNTDRDGLCALCRRKAETEPAAEPTAEGVDLDKLVAGILLIHDALHPGELVNISLEVAALGVGADCWSVGRSIRHIARRHGIIARGERGKPGYAVERWERRYQPVLAFGGGIMDRDEESGKYRGRWRGRTSSSRGKSTSVPAGRRNSGLPTGSTRPTRTSDAPTDARHEAGRASGPFRC